MRNFIQALVRCADGERVVFPVPEETYDVSSKPLFLSRAQDGIS